MKVPSAVIQGRSMWLNCSYDLESDELYSVKWYKNDTEFYRYIPRDRPPAQNYDLPGVVVDVSLPSLPTNMLPRVESSFIISYEFT